jgi:hypothetical protein
MGRLGLEFPPVPARRSLLALVLAAAVLAAGCGSDDDGGSADQKLLVAQANADIQEFCAVSGSKGAVYDLAYFAMLDAVDALAKAYKDDRNTEVNLDPERNRDVPVSKVVTDAAQRLSRGCGKDGKQQAARLQRTVQQQ